VLEDFCRQSDLSEPFRLSRFKQLISSLHSSYNFEVTIYSVHQVQQRTQYVTYSEHSTSCTAIYSLHHVHFYKTVEFFITSIYLCAFYLLQPLFCSFRILLSQKYQEKIHEVSGMSWKNMGFFCALNSRNHERDSCESEIIPIRDTNWKWITGIRYR
jgi:hypothetical protein